MLLAKVARFVGKVVFSTSSVINNAGSAIIFALMILVTLDVVLRYIINRPIKGSNELSEFLMVGIVFFGLAYTAAQRGHVAVDVLVSRLPQRVQAFFDVVIYLISTGMFGMLAWRTFVYANYIMGRGATTGDLLLPVFPVLFVAAFGIALLFLVCLVLFIGSLAKAVKA